MRRKPDVALTYRPHDLEKVRAGCLLLATYLGSFIDDFVVVGGLVPSLLIPPERLPSGVDRHVGTMDLDLGLSLAVLDGSRYTELAQQLKSAGFAPDMNSAGRPANHRWRHSTGLTVDFLIAPSGPPEPERRIRVIDDQLSAVLAEGVPLAFRNRHKVAIDGATLAGERATREVWVCGAGAFICLKALAFRGRGENKDAYDLLYVNPELWQRPQFHRGRGPAAPRHRTGASRDGGSQGRLQRRQCGGDQARGGLSRSNRR